MGLRRKGPGDQKRTREHRGGVDEAAAEVPTCKGNEVRADPETPLAKALRDGTLGETSPSPFMPEVSHAGAEVPTL